MSGVINKVKDAVSGHHGSGETTTHGPHSSKIANKLDPRVDSTSTQSSSPHGHPHPSRKSTD